MKYFGTGNADGSRRMAQLLGLACEDVDICISTLTGHHFATLLEQYLASKTHRGSDMYKTSKIAKIVANPDQSKHLETARMTVWGMEIDFVQLRSEEYAQGSKDRIPTAVVSMMPQTPS